MSGFELDMKQTLTDLINSNKYFQFSRDTCPDCIYVNGIWTKFDLTEKLFIFDIGSFTKDVQEQWRVAFEELTGGRNLPTIMIDGKFWATEKEIHEFEDSNKLEEQLKSIKLL